MRDGLTFHLILHTHWDREWYLPRAAFVPRLVTAMADMLTLLGHDDNARFVLDGQTVLVNDVLDVMPEWTDRVATMVHRRRLEVGPWYILADELIPSGESLLHNLLQGARDAAAFGGRLDVMYSPDAFGHPAILPTLAHQFGITSGVFWRGADDLSDLDRDLYHWRGPDGTEVLLYHLPHAGYEIGVGLAGPDGTLADAWAKIRPELVARATTPHVAVFLGADHHAPPRDIESIRSQLQAIESTQTVRLSTLTEFFAAVRREPIAPHKITGELRWSARHTWTLQGVHATRVRLKGQHGLAELRLQRHAEPLAALAAWHAAIDRRGILRAAWRTLLQCQFHDTLAGCSSDPVAREQETRLTSVQAMSSEISRTALHDLVRHDADDARDAPIAPPPAVVLWNPVPRERTAIITAEITCFRRDVLVGPPTGRQPRVGAGFAPFALAGPDNEVIPIQILSVTPGVERIDAARHYPDQDEVDRVRIAFRAPPVPGLGITGLALRAGRVASAPTRLPAAGTALTNQYVNVQIGPRGRIDLVDRRTGQRYDHLLQLIDERDHGDTYTPWIAAEPARSPIFGPYATLAAGPFITAISAHFRMTAAGEGRIAGRLVLMLHADSAVLRARLEMDNRARDHRLRIRLPIGAGDVAVAGAAFGFEQRDPIRTPGDAFPVEWPARTAPAHRYVAMGAGNRGVAFLMPGFFEYEWTTGQHLLVTLLRSVGELSRAELPPRPGHAGWPTATPEAQEPGRHVMEFGVMPFDTAGNVEAWERAWEDTFLPLHATGIRNFTGRIDALGDFGIELEGDGLVFTACKPAEQSNDVVLRCYNCASGSVQGRWRVRGGIASAALIRADETVLRPLPIVDSEIIDFLVPARGISSILIRRVP